MLEKALSIGLVAVLIASVPVSAQDTAQNTAAILQTWRTACADPNPDLAIGYLQEAMNTKNRLVNRVCLRQVLESDNADVRSTALRIVVGSVPLIQFRVSKPEGEIGNNAQLWSYIQTGLVFQAVDGDPQNGSATWHSLVTNAQPNKNLAGQVDVFGSGLRWAGRVQIGVATNTCRLSAELTQGDAISGTFQCEAGPLFPVTASLLD